MPTTIRSALAGVLALLSLTLSAGYPMALAAQHTAFLDQNSLVVNAPDGRRLLSLGPVLWGPGWAWTGWESRWETQPDLTPHAPGTPAAPGARGTPGTHGAVPGAPGTPAAAAGADRAPGTHGTPGGYRAVGVLTGRMGRTDVPFELSIEVRQIAPDTLRLSYRLRVERDTDLTAAVVALEAGEGFRGAQALRVAGEGGDRALPMPLPIGAISEAVTRVELAGRAVLTPEVPAAVTSDGALRLLLAADRARAAEPVTLVLDLKLDQPVTFFASPALVPTPEDWDRWFPFEPADVPAGPSLTDASAFLDAPAGRHGRITRDGDRLIYNGQPIRLWGLNVSFAACAPDRQLAARRADFYARHGVNSVRLHKFMDGPGWAGIMDPNDSTRFEPEGLDRMDFFVHQLKQRGIFVKLSANFGRPVIGPANRAAVPFADELAERPGPMINPGGGAIWHSTELQDLQIAQIVNLLRHTNPHTGMTYAQDPAVAVIELINEESALFFGSMSALQRSPTLRQRAGRDFADWLLRRYGSAQAIRAAWGDRAINSFAHEGLADERFPEVIYPVGNPWFWDPDNLDTSQAFRRQRLLDTMVFLYERQNAFYDRFVQAIRATGYEGEILASNWQAGRAFSHFLNLHSDARIGIVDRHNYFNEGTMVHRPGSGSLSAGLQQVAGVPFMLSEWIHVFPNPWGVEGPAIIGAYAMGLQGWDVSYLFQNGDDGRFARQIGRQQWEVAAPQIMGIFPAVSRQVLRGDVRTCQAPVARFVHVDSLKQGRIGFDDRVRHLGDIKELDSATVPAESLAVVRSVVEFTDSFRETPPFDLTPFRDGDAFVSSTRQLRWTPGASVHDGHFTIDTPGTQAVVGFARDLTARLTDFAITPGSRFAAIYISAPGPDETIATAPSLLLTLLAQARNTDMRFIGDTLLQRGRAPVLLQPVRVELTPVRRRITAIHILDHNGVRTGRTIPVPASGPIVIDTAETRSPYIELVAAP